MTQDQYRRREWDAVMLFEPLSFCMAPSVKSCEICGARAEDAAHIVERSKRNIARYGFEAVNSRFNMIPTCKKHNATAMNAARGPAGEAAHMADVMAKIKEFGTGMNNESL